MILRVLLGDDGAAAAVVRYLEQDKDMAAMILGLLLITVCVAAAIVAGMWDTARRRRTSRRTRRSASTRSRPSRPRSGPVAAVADLSTPEINRAFEAITSHLQDLQQRGRRTP